MSRSQMMNFSLPYCKSNIFLVLEQKAVGSTATFDVGRLPKGVYMVSVRTAAGATTKRLLVE